MDPRGGCHADERERQGEHGVGDFDEVGVRHQPASAGQYLAVDAARRRHGSRMPSPAHFASTARRVASSITIRSGHSRVNPSSGHLRVASTPILEP